MARAAPLLAGMIESAAARMRRRSGVPLRLVWARSWSDWSVV